MLNDPLGKKKREGDGGGLLPRDNWILICDGTSQYRMEKGYWHLKLFLIWSVSKSYALCVLALCPFGQLQFPVAQHIIWVVCLYTIRRIPAIPMTAALQSWERISPGLQTGMLPFMAVSACSQGLACTRRYVPADLKQRWLSCSGPPGKCVGGGKLHAKRILNTVCDFSCLTTFQHLALCLGGEKFCACLFGTP